MKFFSKWKKTLTANGKNRDWFDRDSVKGGNFSLIISLLFILLSGLGFIWFGTQMFILSATSIAVMLLSLAIPHHTFEGRIKYFEWKAFRKYLQKQKFSTEANDVVLNKINKLFVFGSLFGVRKKYFKELGETIPASGYRHYVPWYVLNSSRENAFSPGSFGTAISSMLSTTGTAMSSASGAGGGASGGGGGGAGSGGGGAG